MAAAIFGGVSLIGGYLLGQHMETIVDSVNGTVNYNARFYIRQNLNLFYRVQNYLKTKSLVGGKKLYFNNGSDFVYTGLIMTFCPIVSFNIVVKKEFDERKNFLEVEGGDYFEINCYKANTTRDGGPGSFTLDQFLEILKRNYSSGDLIEIFESPKGFGRDWMKVKELNCNLGGDAGRNKEIFDQVKRDLDTYLQTEKSLYRNDKLTLLFHGEPGAGKSTMVKQIAQHMKRNIYYLNCSDYFPTDPMRPGNDVSGLTKNCQNHLLVIEDFDSYLSTVTERTDLAPLLNVFDGALTPNNVVIVITMNCQPSEVELPESMIKKLFRKGRLDHIYDFTPIKEFSSSDFDSGSVSGTESE